MNIAVIGLGKLGTPVAHAIASKGHRVVGFDINREAMKPRETYPFVEAGATIGSSFDEFAAAHPIEYLSLAHACGVYDDEDLDPDPKFDPDLIFVAVQTPHEPDLEGTLPILRSADFDYTHLEAVLAKLEALCKGKTIVVISTVAPGTWTDRLSGIVKLNNFIYNPFFIAMGTVIPDFLKPEFVLIGRTLAEVDVPSSELVDFYKTIHDRPARVMSVASAEMVKMGYNCFSADTEVLSTSGWRRFSELTGSEQVFSVNPESLIVEWSGIRKIVHRPHSGDMLRFRSAKDDVLVTPDHNMFVGRMVNRPANGKNYSYRWYIRQAEDVEKLNTFAFCRSVCWDGEDPVFVRLSGGVGVPSDLMAEFLGWYLAEGCVGDKNGITISQLRSVNPVKYAEVERICRRMLGVLGKDTKQGHAGPAGFTFYDPGLAEYLRPLGKALTKRLPEECRGWTKALILKILEGLCSGDGSKQKSRRWASGTKELRDRRYFSTSSPKLAADIAELIVKVGRHPSCREQKSGLSGRTNYLIYELLGETSVYQRSGSAGLKVFRESYSGEVWCASLERNHVMLTRRGGKCSWQGNCAITAKICMANFLGEMAQACNADVDDVTEALQAATDRIVSPRYMTAGMGDSGGCHPRDGLVMSHLAEKFQLSFDLAGAMMQCREAQAMRLAQLLIQHARGRRIVILGTAFKPGVRIKTGSSAILVANILRGLGHTVNEWDPLDHPEGLNSLPPIDRVFPCCALIGCKHEVLQDVARYLPKGSTVIDPHRFVDDAGGVDVIQLGRAS